jgi:hypothetical protein
MLGTLTPSSTIKKTGKHKISLAFNNQEKCVKEHYLIKYWK